MAELASGFSIGGINRVRSDLSTIIHQPRHGPGGRFRNSLGLGRRQAGGRPPPHPIEASFDRDYPAPGFKPSWKKPQINRLFVQDFVIYAHSELDMVKKLLDKEPTLINAMMDWGGGDWESGLGGRHTWAAAISSNSCSNAGRASTSSAPP